MRRFDAAPWQLKILLGDNVILEFVGDYPSQVWTGGFLALHSGTLTELRDLAYAIDILCRTEKGRLAVHELTYVSPLLECQLHGVSARADQGVLARNAPRAFTLVLSQQSWESARSAILNFAAGHSHVLSCHLNPTRFGPPVVYSVNPPPSSRCREGDA